MPDTAQAFVKQAIKNISLFNHSSPQGLAISRLMFSFCLSGRPKGCPVFLCNGSCLHLYYGSYLYEPLLITPTAFFTLNQNTCIFATVAYAVYKHIYKPVEKYTG
jgi:hypothetical protein